MAKTHLSAMLKSGFLIALAYFYAKKYLEPESNRHTLR